MFVHIIYYGTTNAMFTCIPAIFEHVHVHVHIHLLCQLVIDCCSFFTSIQPSPRGGTKLRGGRSLRPVPPSMVPARQPKSILKALKGNIVSQSGEVEGERGSDILESERARSRLADITTGADAGALRRSVRSTSLLVKDSFASNIKEE